MVQRWFCERVNELARCGDGIVLESPRIEGFNVFTYAAASERMFEKNLAETSGRERKTTFYSDLAIAEWCEEEDKDAIIDTCQRALSYYTFFNVEMTAELILCINYKAWEHHERGLVGLSRLYAELYKQAYIIAYDYYEANERWDDLDYIIKFMD